MTTGAVRETLSRNPPLKQPSEELQQIEEEITCAICRDLFNDPKTIPCLHTFCKSCLEKSIETNKKMMVDVCCPSCRAPVHSEIASIPTNFTIKSLVDIVTVRRRREDAVECDNCRGIHRHHSSSKIKKAADVTEVTDPPIVSVAAAYWCVHCAKYLCNKCHDAHKQWGEFVEHKCVTIEEIKTTSTQDLKSVLSEDLEGAEIMCKHHCKQLDFYCNDCRCLICHYCTAMDHKDHDYEDKLTEVADKEREKVKHAAAPLDKLLEQVRKAIKELECTEKQISMKGEANVETIRATYDEVYRLLKQQEEEAVDKANAIKHSCVKRLTTQIENAKFLETELSSCDKFRADITEVGRTRKLLKYGDQIANKVDQLKFQVDSSKFDPECTIIDLIMKQRKPVEFINNLGFEQFDVPCMPNCSFSRYGHTVKPTDRDQPDSPNPLPTSPKGNLTRSLLSPFKETTKTDQVKVAVMLKDTFGFLWSINQAI